MMLFTVEIQVMPRAGILDPQGKAVGEALTSLGFGGVGDVHVGRFIRVDVEAASEAEARENAISMCRQLLANPVTEDFEVRVLEGAGR